MPLSNGSLDHQDVRGQLAAVARELYQAGVLTALGGNLSARVTNMECAWITPTRVYKGGLVPEDMVRIDYRGQMVAGPPGMAPSEEASVHAAVYRAREDAAAVVHAHPPHTIIMATIDLPVRAVTEEIAAYVDVPRLAYQPSGSEGLASAVSAALGDGELVMVANHGVFAAGPTLRAAASNVLSLEAACRLTLLAHQFGVGELPEMDEG